jgi:phosphatidylglycerol:prolipoprotein diacylglycerol transferase
MWSYPEIDPIALSIGPLAIRWYALSYLVGIGLVWWVLTRRVRRRSLAWTSEQLSDLAFYAVLGVILGGRMGYMLFYKAGTLIDDPLSLFKIWQGGMSFHGGMLGVLVAMYLYGRSQQRHFFEVTDFIAPAIPLALGSGRIGNFINGELPGRLTDVSWAVIFPGEVLGRHPSSLYQSLLEGPVLFAILWWFSSTSRPMMAVSGLFLIGYGSLRFVSEFFRLPDSHIGFVALDWVSMGQVLSLPMVLIGVGFMTYSYLARPETAVATADNKTTRRSMKKSNNKINKKSDKKAGKR